MCGIAGILLPQPDADRAALTRRATAMAETLRHRGPDGDGVWTDDAAGVALAHRRLSIIDLSPAGAQPMVSAAGHLVISFNGEIYNFRDLRDALARDGIVPRGGSDTAVLIEAIDHWGLEGALSRANGMFALAVWDRTARTLTLARDRLGQKPLYYGLAGTALLFGSELKALRSDPAFCRDVAPQMMAPFMRYGMIPAPHTIHPQAWKLPPGTTLTVTAADLAARRLPEPAAYWSAERCAAAGLADPWPDGETAATDALDALLRDAVAGCMVADVPLGAFLSGGIDSSTVVALMQAQSMRPVRTFSIGFTEAGYNEAAYAKAVAEHLGTDHTELYLSPADAQAVIPDLPHIYDEPFADSSQIPTYLVSRMAREQVTVCLSGDGGDETFGGYNRYLWSRSIARACRFAPQPVRRTLRRLLTAVPPQRWNAVAALLPHGLRQAQAGDKIHKLAEIIDAASPEDVYVRLVSQWHEPLAALRTGSAASTLLAEPGRWPDTGHDRVQQTMLLDMLSYLPDDILVKLDRASMAVSLEARVPLLDHRLTEFAWRLPRRFKIRNGKGKWILREVLRRYVPDALIDRPKMGFGVPIDRWLRNDLRDWAEHLLDPQRLEEGGLFDAPAVRAVWQAHLSGARNVQYRLWPVLMFEAWRTAAAVNDRPAEGGR